jgi:hypothetical protein
VRTSDIYQIVFNVVACSLCCLPTTLSAQDENLRRGFWLSFGIGGGYAIADDSVDGTTVAYYLRLGGTPSEKFTIGGEMILVMKADAFRESPDIGPHGRATMTFSGLYYPVSRSAWFLKGGLGYGILEAASLGFAVDGGTGFDLHLGGSFSITPGVDVVLIAGEETVAHVLLTVGATWH